jgi:hypothetical protein
MTCRVRDKSGTIVLLASLVLMIQKNPRSRKAPRFKGGQAGIGVAQFEPGL